MLHLNNVMCIIITAFMKPGNVIFIILKRMLSYVMLSFYRKKLLSSNALEDPHTNQIGYITVLL